MLTIGFWALRRSESESEYWIAGGRLGWLTGGATLAATHASAGTFIGTIGVMHTTGWAFGWLVLSIPLAYWFLAAVLAPRFLEVRELTLPAFLEHRYGSRGVRGISALIILIATVVYVQAQIVAGGLIAEVVFDVPARSGMVGFALFPGALHDGGRHAGGRLHRSAPARGDVFSGRCSRSRLRSGTWAD